MGDIVGERNAVYRSEVLVALEHADTVARTLRELDVAFEEGERSEDLGLAQLKLSADEQAADRVAPAGGGPTAPRVFTTHLDRFLWGLRTRFAAEHAGWMPTLGKNRLVGHVVGGGRISHGGGTAPRMASPQPGTRASAPGAGVRVGVLDTALYPQPWLAGGWVGPAADVLGGQPPHRAVAGHGTFVAGLVLGRAPGCVVEVRKVLSDDAGEADAWSVAKKIVELGRTGVDVLNLSMVCYTEDGQPPLVLAAAIDRLHPDTVVVAAAGNHGGLPTEPAPDDRRKPTWPAALDDVIAVGAANTDGSIPDLTPRKVPWIDVLAPGMDVVSTFLTGKVDVDLSGEAPEVTEFQGYAAWDGSSFAAALVSGAIAGGTVPGRTSARDAWRELLGTAVTSADGDPPFLPLQGR